MKDKTFTYIIAEKNFLTAKHLQLIIRPTTEQLYYKAGQYLEVRYPNGLFLPFSIANAPNTAGHIELHIKITPTDADTVQFIESIEPGSTITLSGPYGECQYEQKSSGVLLLLAAGTGFAPAKAIIEQIIRTDANKECHLYWTTKHQTDFYLSQLPSLWHDQLPNFHYTQISTQEDESPKVNILDQVLNDFVDCKNCQVYVFGPQNLAIDALRLLRDKGINERNFYTDMLSKASVLELIRSF